LWRKSEGKGYLDMGFKTDMTTTGSLKKAGGLETPEPRQIRGPVKQNRTRKEIQRGGVEGGGGNKTKNKKKKGEIVKGGT